jgi:hypothetical protein
MTLSAHIFQYIDEGRVGEDLEGSDRGLVEVFSSYYFRESRKKTAMAR